MRTMGSSRGDRLETVGSRSLPLGAIRPQGWILDQLRLQAAGLTGHLEEIWPDVGPTSAWRGGDGEDWERGPYYLDGLVPLAFLLEDDALIARASVWIEWILSSQRPDGSFGPRSNDDWWPRMVALKALTQWNEATSDARVHRFLRRYFQHQLNELPRRPLTSWGAARGADNMLSVWWLYDRVPEPWLLDLIDLLSSQTTDWDAYLGRGVITGPARVFNHLTHSVNVAMGLKTGAVHARRDGDIAGHRAAFEASWGALERWHGQVHGVFSGDEWLGGRAPTAGVETCQVMELLFTLEQDARILGGAEMGDRLERVAFNLLPASCTADMRAHQYLQQANQVQVSVAQRRWTHAGDDANIFGLEPNFGCCTANLHQGWPKFVSSLWVRDEDDALRVIAYAPCVVDATVSDTSMRLSVETDYPFEQQVRIEVLPEKPVAATIRLRVPTWAHAVTVVVSNQSVDLPTVDGHIELSREWTGSETVFLHFESTLTAVSREEQAVGIWLGPLALVLEIPENWMAVADAPGLGEWEVHPRTSWHMGLTRLQDIAKWQIHNRSPVHPPWSLERAPVEVRTHGARLHNWRTDGHQAGPVPGSPVFEAGPESDITLVPYGCARLRVAEFPFVLRVQPDHP